MTSAAFLEFDRLSGKPAPTHVDLRIIAQDPSVTGDDGHVLTATAQVPWARLEPGPAAPRFQVVDFDATTGRIHEPAVLPSDEDRFRDVDDATLRDDFDFHAQQVYAVAARTLATFESALGRRLPWRFDGHQLFLVPHAFSEANAYYSWEDRALLFGYVPVEDGTVYTCLSHDVVAHETSHAVLDGLRRRFLEPGLPDQAAFHEGFADLVALLSVFSLQPVVEACLGTRTQLTPDSVTSDALRHSALTGVAEQLGAALSQGRGALRQSALLLPPHGWADLAEYAEPHRRGEVLVAAVLDVLVDIWTRRLQPLLDGDGVRRPRTIDRSRTAEEGAKAAGHLLTMLIRGLDLLPPVEFEFADLLDAIVLADEEVVPDDDLHYRELLVDRFARFGIVRPEGSRQDLLSGAFVPAYQGLNFAAMRTDADEVFRFMWHNAAALGLDTSYYTHVESVRPSQRVGPDGLVVSESIATYVQMLELTAAELTERLGAPLSVQLEPTLPVQVFGGGTLAFDQFGRAKLHVYKRLDDWQRQDRRLHYLHEAGLYDRKGRLGFSVGMARGQAFAEMHAADSASGEAW